VLSSKIQLQSRSHEPPSTDLINMTSSHMAPHSTPAQKHALGTGNVRLYCEDSGQGAPVVFVHEFAGSCRSFDGQLDAFLPRHRCVAFNARGYPPSDVPDQVSAYSEPNAASDLLAVLDQMGLQRAHLLGVSMGAAAVLQCALDHPERVLSMTLVGIGNGSDSDAAHINAYTEANAGMIETQGMAALAEKMAASPMRFRLRQKLPAECDRFIELFSSLSARGAANTMRGVQQKRPSLYVHAQRIAQLMCPTLVVVGGEDEGCLKPSRFLQQTLPHAQLHVFPGTGHAVNLENPAEFNRLCLSFLASIDAAGHA
jgi:pimeloyl-ACP methyl ester carboxylesterase